MRAGAGSRSSARASTCTTSLSIRAPARSTPAASTRAPGGRSTAVRTGRASGDSTSSGVIESSPTPRRRNASTSPRSEGASGTDPQPGIRPPPKMSWSPRGSSDAANWYPVSLAARPVRRGRRERSSQRRNGANGGRTEKRMRGRRGRWGVTPAAAGVRVARVATGTMGPSRPLATRAPARPSSRPTRRVELHSSSPFVLRCLRSSVVNSVAFATSRSRPPQLLGSRSDDPLPPN